MKYLAKAIFYPKPPGFALQAQEAAKRFLINFPQTMTPYYIIAEVKIIL
jgi:hypothetical protein